MDWLEDDEMTRQWEDVSKEEEKITVRKMEGRSLQVEGAHKALELLVSQVLTKEKEPKKEMKKSKVSGRSKEKEEKASKREFKDAEEMVQWRSIDQEGINNVCVEQLSEKLGKK